MASSGTTFGPGVWDDREAAPCGAPQHARLGGMPLALAHLIIATTMYREMDMRLRLEQGEAETGEFR